MKKNKVIILLLIISSLWYSWKQYQELYVCIPSGSGDAIQRVIDRGAQYIRLCQGAHFDLTNPVTLKKAGQELSTIGYPTDSSDKALLKLTSGDSSLAVNAYNVENAVIKNIRVDGNRRELGQIISHGLILTGGNVSNQVISNIEAFDSRSWTTIHVNRGDFYRDESSALHSHCSGVVVKHNLIGPSGETSIGKWSDGISVQCENSQIIENTITDVTDGGIVIFGAPGSKITGNTIIADKMPLLVGIAMVDYAYEGNYRDTEVRNNTIESKGVGIKAGIAMGPSTWGCHERDKRNYEGSVVNNRLIGKNFGYGLVASGVKDWIVRGNIVDAQFSRSRSHDCENKPNALPAAFVFEESSVNGDFQSEFKNGHVGAVHTLQL